MNDSTARYLLDTNIASYIIKGNPPATRHRLAQVPMAAVAISAITEAALRRGVAKRPEASKLHIAVNAFLLRVDILPWDSAAATSYATLRTAAERDGISLGAMDMLIAAHAMASGRVLVTNDQAFYRLETHLQLEDWTR